MNKSILIVAALLVATAAGQSLDILARYNNYQQQDGFNQPLYSRSLRRLLGHPLERSLIYGESLQVPSYLRDDIFDVNVLQIEDFIMHPLFPVYMRLPYFQQYWSYPMFQRYVCSQYFQRFWELPSFQQYFVSPVLFYKYIYPLVNIYKYDTITPTTYGYPYTTTKYTGGYSPFYYPTEFQQQQQQQQVPEGLEIYYKTLLQEMMTNLQNSQQQQQQIVSTSGMEAVPEEKKEDDKEETIVEETTTGNSNIQSVSGDANVVDETVVEKDDKPVTIIPSTTTTTTVLPEQRVFNPSMYNMNNNYYNPSRYPLVRMFPGNYY